MRATCIIVCSMVWGLVSSGQVVAQPRSEHSVASLPPAVLPQQRLDYVLNLDADKIATLKRTGFLYGRFPRNMSDRIDAMVLRVASPFRDQPQELHGAIDKQNQTLLVAVDDSVLDGLAYRSVRLPVYESDFSMIRIAYQPGRHLLEEPESTIDRRSDSLPVWVRLKNGKGLPGHLAGQKTVKVTTELGELDLPVAKIAGIQFDLSRSETDAVQDQKGDDEEIASAKQVVVVLLNGDTLSGTFSEPTLVLNTRWGRQTFSVSEVDSLVQNAGIRLEAPGASLGRWHIGPSHSARRSDRSSRPNP